MLRYSSRYIKTAANQQPLLREIDYNNDRCAFIYLYVTLCQWYLWIKVVNIYLGSYYFTIFTLILFQYDTSLSNNFCDIIDQWG